MSFERMMKRFNRISKEKLQDLRKHEFHETRSQVKRRRRAAAAVREKQRQAEQEKPR